jgi:hypothetical protein
VSLEAESSRSALQIVWRVARIDALGGAAVRVPEVMGDLRHGHASLSHPDGSSAPVNRIWFQLSWSKPAKANAALCKVVGYLQEVRAGKAQAETGGTHTEFLAELWNKSSLAEFWLRGIAGR